MLILGEAAVDKVGEAGTGTSYCRLFKYKDWWVRVGKDLSRSKGDRITRYQTKESILKYNFIYTEVGHRQGLGSHFIFWNKCSHDIRMWHCWSESLGSSPLPTDNLTCKQVTSRRHNVGQKSATNKVQRQRRG